jgi:hypothetical protein
VNRKEGRKKGMSEEKDEEESTVHRIGGRGDESAP